MTAASRRIFLGGLAATAVGCAARPPAPPTQPPPRALRILVMGGTGFLGPPTVTEARAHGHVVTLFNRGKTKPHLFPDVEKIHGDRKKDVSALRGRVWDVVIDTSGYTPGDVTRVTDALAGGPSHYVFVSTISVYAPSRAPIDETSAVATIADPTIEKVDDTTYGALKALAESAAERALPGRTTAVRPGLIVGPGDPTDRFTYWPVRIARGGEVIAPGTPTDPVQIIDVRDLASFLVRVAEERVFGTFNAVGPAETIGIGALLEACKRGVASDAKLVWVPASFLQSEKVEPWSDMPVWVPPDGEESGMSRTSAQRAIARGLAFRPIVDTARDTLAFFRAEPEERRAKLRAGLPAEREAAVLAAWKASASATR